MMGVSEVLFLQVSWRSIITYGKIKRILNPSLTDHFNNFP